MDVFGVERLARAEDPATVEDGLAVATAVETLMAEPPPGPNAMLRRPDSSVTRYLRRDDRPWFEGLAVVSTPYERPTADMDHEYTYLAAIQNFRLETDPSGETTAIESLNVDRELMPHVTRTLLDPIGRVTAVATKPATQQEVASALHEMATLKGPSDASHDATGFR